MPDEASIGKNIIVCCDGTGNEYCETNTNVVRLFEMIEKNNPNQVAYYDPGVGTIGSRAAINRLEKWFTRMLGLAFGYGMTTNIEEAYEFLIDNYQENDRVFLFGFSRGAYTVRAIAGFLIKCGLLHKNCRNQIPYAMGIYRNRKIKNDSDVAKGFRDTFSRKCVPYFIGVWDTVNSTVVNRYTFKDFILNKDIQYGYQAIAIDEKRFFFQPVFWNPPADGQTIEQVWFPGVHSDIGGSYKERGLSEITLKWMIDKAQKCGLRVSPQGYQTISPDCWTKIHRSYKGFWLPLGIHKRNIEDNSWVSTCAYRKMGGHDRYAPHNLPDKARVTLIGDERDCN